MLKNNLKIAFRNLFKNKVYSVINIVGLGLGMSVSILILMFVMHEFSYDKFHKNAPRIYRVLAKLKIGENDLQLNSFSSRLGPAVRASSASVEEFVRLKTTVDKVVIRNPEKGSDVFYESKFMFADPSFFKMFSFKIKNGDANGFTDKPFSMVISERAAHKYFGDNDPVGKTLVYENGHLMQITAVAENPPSNSTFDFDFVVSSSTFPRLNKEYKAIWEKEGAFNLYVLLNSAESAAAVEKVVKAESIKSGNSDDRASYSLEPLTTIHLGNNFQDSGNSRLIYVFMGVALMILFLALFNYMSLTTARSTLRAKEVGVRKVAGAGRGGLIGQFYTESVLVCCLAFGVAFLFVQLLRNPFYDLLNLRIDSSFLLSPAFIGILAVLLVLSAFLAGSYPALILSGFAPLEVLKGRFTSQQKGAVLRRFFMVFQFTVSIVLIICSLVVKSQLSFMQNKKLGIYKDQVLTVPLSKTIGKNFLPMRQEISQQVGVEQVTVANTGLFKGYNMWFVKNVATQKDVPFITMMVDENFTNTLGLQWKTEPQKGSLKSGGKMLINESAIKQLGFDGNPVGQKIMDNIEIAGVVRNFNFASVQNEIQGLGLLVVNDTTNLLGYSGAAGILYARLEPRADIQQKVAEIGKIYKKYDSKTPFEYYFLDDAFNETFKTEIRMSGMFSVFTAFAIFIACMGLFGLVTFTAETRTKEIGIRKVLGASIRSIVRLISSDFLKLIMLSILIASPIAWYLMQKWLQDFAYKIEIQWWMFTVTGLLTIAIVLVTISFQSIKAALMNPVEALKTE